MLFLAISSFGLRVFMAHLDPFLGQWDERYHALVAKNFLRHPLTPTLYDNPVIWNINTLCTISHIWMHKQPLALWQMALSFYFFGVNQFTARIPMVIEGALMTFLVYRISSIAINKQAGYLSALIYTVSFYALDFMTGGQSLDDVDYALFFYISASLWSWMEFSKSEKNVWLIFIGVFSGFAFMSKWSGGFLFIQHGVLLSLLLLLCEIKSVHI